MVMTMNTGNTDSTYSASGSNGAFLEKSREADKVRAKVAATVTQWFTMAKQDRWKQERQWYLNIAFYYGQQHVIFRNVPQGSAAAFDLWVPPAPYYRVRPTINHTRRIIRKEISRMVSQKPNAYVMPASSEDRDIFAAQAGEAIWDSMWRKHKLNQKIRRTAFWTAVCGNGFLKQYWDMDKLDVDNNQLGDLVFEAETPFHIFIPDLKQEELEDQEYLIHAQLMSPYQVSRRFDTEISTNTGSPDVVDEHLLQIMGANQFNSKDAVVVLECWIKPGTMKELPEGGMVTIVNQKLVQGWQGWPFSHGQYPFSKIDNIPTGKFYTESVITDLIPLQRELNRTRGQIIEAKNRMAKPQLLIEEGSLDPAKITSEPGQVIPYKPGFNQPAPLPMTDLPAYVSQEVDRLYADMADLSGQHEVSQGNVPPGVTAATAISYLQEQDESLSAPTYDSLEEAIEKTAKQTLSYVKDFWEIPRIVKIVGIDGSFDAQAFKGSDLNDNTDIRVEGGSALPTSRAAKQAFIMDMMKMGFIPPEEGLEVMEIGGINKIYERLQVDVRQAQRENLKMRVISEDDMRMHFEEWDAKEPQEKMDPNTMQMLDPPLLVPVNTYDRHEVHIEIHNRYRKSQSFEMVSPLTKQIFEEHVKQHQEALMQQQALSMGNPLQPGGQSGQEQGQGPQQPPGPEPAPELESEEVI